VSTDAAAGHFAVVTDRIADQAIGEVLVPLGEASWTYKKGLKILTLVQFRLILFAALGVLFIILAARSETRSQPVDIYDGRLHVFFSPECPHCHRALAFLGEHPDIVVVLHDVSRHEKFELLIATADSLRLADEEFGVPLFVRNGQHLVGFESAEITGPLLITLATQAVPGGKTATGAQRVNVPILGVIDPTAYSLPVLTVIMGLADGFNPCAMWVLVYLISIIASVREPAKIWWIVGTFVTASGVLYFLFMTAWLNAFLFVGHVHYLTLLVSVAAIGIGADQLFRLLASRGNVACKLDDDERRQGIMSKARAIVAAPVGFASVALVVALAFTVNAIEFACSAALPAIYTHTLTMLDLTPTAHYLYIFLYVIVFMLDDLIIFGMAAFAVQKVLDTRYAAMSQAIGGIVLIGLGIVLATSGWAA